MMQRPKLVLGLGVIAAALGYMIYAGVTQSAIYFVTPSELLAAPVSGKAYRLGGMVAPGSVRWNPGTLELAFTITDGKRTVSVRHHGSPPDLFAEGRGAVVEGRWTADEAFKSSLIMAKHSEEYKAPSGGGTPDHQELLRTLRAPK